MPVEITEERLRFAIQSMADLTGEKEFIVIGRGTLSFTAPPKLRSIFAQTDDIDLWPRDKEDAALDECIDRFGEESQFSRDHGYYIERVGSWTLMTQPPGWEDRATEINVGDSKALLLGLYDLAYNKLEAFRDKDQQFITQAFEQGLLDQSKLRAFVDQYAPTNDTKEILRRNLTAIIEPPSPSLSR